MTAEKPQQAVVLAAGFGRRMMPLTENCPKPLLEVGGRSILDRIFDALVAAGVKHAVVNMHYLAEQIAEHCAKRTDLQITTVYEPDILETGGGTKNALQFIDNKPFYVLNGDVIWQDFPGHVPALDGLAESWNSAQADLLLMLYPRIKLPESSGLKGDYDMDADGKIHHRSGGEYVFAGPRIVAPHLFDDVPDGAFSFLDLFHKAEAAGRLYGFVHQGVWHHAGTPEDLAQIDGAYRSLPEQQSLAQ
ncbi:MAG: nucleotidyltransferase family protein [Micavibrio sp.]|nr:MAG: nucleotidyltransferase family protein [Micavibrio sp.]